MSGWPERASRRSGLREAPAALALVAMLLVAAAIAVTSGRHRTQQPRRARLTHVHRRPRASSIPVSHALRQMIYGNKRSARVHAPPVLLALLLSAAVAIGACGGSSHHSPVPVPDGKLVSREPDRGSGRSGYHVLPLLDPHNVYAADRTLSPVVQGFRKLVYVPNSGSNTVEEIDPTTYRVVRQFSVGLLPQHVVPSYDLRTLWVTNDEGNTLTPIDPRTGAPGQPVPVEDPYNMYYTPDGRYAVVMEERLREIAFRNAQTMKLHHIVNVSQCAGVNHADYTADGRLMLASCEFGSAMIVVNIPHERVVRTLPLPSGGSPQDVKLAPDGSVFYVADLTYGGLWVFDAHSFRRLGFVRTGAGAHGLYPSRDAKSLYISNRGAGTISVLSFATRRVAATWTLPGGGSPDMGNVSASGHMLWLSGRYDATVYAIDTRTGRLIRRIPVGAGPHGLCWYPQPGRYSLGHTGIMR